MKKKPVVWYVDDLPENLAKFTRNHKQAFTIKTFATPEEVRASLLESQPDALLCDIFFYDNPETAEDMERKVQEKATELRNFGVQIGANREENLAGIHLIQTVSERFGTRFPIYAYTSKGPYLLDHFGFDRIGNAGARWLFKNRYDSSTEQAIIQQDINYFRLKNSFALRAARYFWFGLFTSGILGGLVVWLLTEELPKLFK